MVGERPDAGVAAEGEERRVEILAFLTRPWGGGRGGQRKAKQGVGCGTPKLGLRLPISPHVPLGCGCKDRPPSTFGRVNSYASRHQPPGWASLPLRDRAASSKAGGGSS